MEAMLIIRQSFLGKALNSWNPNGSSLMSLLLFPKGPGLHRSPLQTNSKGLKNRVVQAVESLSCIHYQDRITGRWREEHHLEN